MSGVESGSSIRSCFAWAPPTRCSATRRPRTSRSPATRSARLATRLYGVVVPRDRWIVRAGLWLERLLFAVRRSPYRPYAHRNALIDRRVADQGLVPVAETGTFGWRVVLYQRVSAGGQA